MTNAYIVVRLVPEAPVDGPTFATYLDGLRLQLIDAYTGAPLSDYVYSSPLIIGPNGTGFGAVVSVMTSDTTKFVSANNYGNQLTFNSTEAVSVGSFVYSADNANSGKPSIPFGSNLKVIEVADGVVTLNGNLPNYVPAGTVVEFVPTVLGTITTDPTAAAPTFTANANGAITGIDGNPPSGTNPGIVVPMTSVDGIIVGTSITGTGIAAGVTVAAVNAAGSSIVLSVAVASGVTQVGPVLAFKWPVPFMSLTLTATANTANTLTFGATDGVAFGMTLTPVAGEIDPGTTVIDVTGTVVTLSKNLLVATPSNPITFNVQLSSGIAQLTEIDTSITFTGFGAVIVPKALATAVIPLNSLPTYVNVRVIATRDSDTLPVDQTFYNVVCETGALPDPSQYQNIPGNQTGFYLSLPPPPLDTFVSLTVPSDGSPPDFDELIKAINAVLANEPTLPQHPEELIASPANCRRVAYDIVWSYQNTLPDPPDVLEDMYTKPTNPGGSGGNGGQNNLEQDRIKFEGSIQSFYSTRNADAERLAKFVAAASAAVYCEESSLNSTSALLDFPVDPSAPFETAVESELRVQGLGVGSSSGLAFGVPAAFFYALGASHDKSATAIQRFQTATGDAIDRLLHVFAVARNTGVIRATEAFANTTLSLPAISPFQAARRLFALRASAASTTPTVVAYAGTLLTNLIKDWLNADDPTPVPAPNPPPTFQTVDFDIWVKKLEVSDPQGYLYLDLDSLTQGYVIPSFTAAVTTGAGTTLTFDGSGTGIATGMPVTGLNIAAGTVVANVVVNTVAGASTTTVTLSAAVTGAITNNQVITFNNPVPPALATTLADVIFNWLPSTASPPASQTIDTLKKVTSVQWTTLFTMAGNQAWLPPFTQPVQPGASTNVPDPAGGYTALRIRAFVRAVQQFFAISTVSPSAKLPDPDAPPMFDLPPYDPIMKAVQSMAGFNFSIPLNAASLASAVQTVFPTDVPAQRWLTDAMTAISELYLVASVVAEPTVLPNPVSLRFSIIEALYARGFRNASDITSLSAVEFQQALTGTVAYDFASGGVNSLYQKAASIAPPPSATPPDASTFQPINPDGSLVNCIPPPCLSPTSPIAYLQELLRLSPASNCESVWAPPIKPQLTLGQAVQARRGPLGDLLASCANLESPLLLVDVVNESLEFLAATVPPDGGPTTTAPHGAIYNTSVDAVAGHELCRSGDCAQNGDGCHEPATLFAALSEYSTPATPVAANQAVEPRAFNYLKSDLSCCELPYSQALDVSRTYLGHFGTCRFEELRTFRKCITEFALAPTQPPTGFQSHLWRYPVRIETAIEYLGITPEEYADVFAGTAPLPCSGVVDEPDATHALGQSLALKARERAVDLQEVLDTLCLNYCEFREFAQLGLVQVYRAISGSPSDPAASPPSDEREGGGAAAEPAAGTGEATGPATGTMEGPMDLPECEPCCLKDYAVAIVGIDKDNSAVTVIVALIRLWKKLQQLCGARYSFQELSDICTVLKFVDGGGALNPEFIRQLAAFQMLRDQFTLPLRDPSAQVGAGQTGADRTHLLSLWVGSGAAKWDWAVHELVEGVIAHARQRYGMNRPKEFAVHMVQNLDALSRLAGFNPIVSGSSAADTWSSSPACTLRLAEVLAKMAGSSFHIGELLYLFNAIPPDHAANPFPEQDSGDALIHPLGLPVDEPEPSLWRLREQLLAVDLSEDEACEWTWPRICSALHDKFGYAPTGGQDPLLSIGQHFFPHVLAAAGYAGGMQHRRYRVALTSTTDWNFIPGTPFLYDSGTSELSVQLPLRDEAVAATLSRMPQLNAAEQVAVQDLYFLPRLELTLLACLFPDWQSAQRHLIEEPEEERRWAYFRRHFALANARRHIIVKHLARHVERATDCDGERIHEIAALVLSRLLADENDGTPWEFDSGTVPTVMWTPAPSGTAIAALLGLIGTGLVGEYDAPLPVGCTEPPAATPETATSALWREVRGPFRAFGHESDESNSPVPTVLPALSLPLVGSTLVDVQNGYALRSGTGRPLGGAEGFRVRWSGSLLIEREGEYEFHAGAPTPRGERPDFECARRSQWRMTLHRGQKTRTVLNHEWPGDAHHGHHPLHLRRGAYHIVVEYNQPTPTFGEHEVHSHRTGFEVKYAGPDSDGQLICIPLSQLFRELKNHTLDHGIQCISGGHNAQAFLKGFYTSTLRDIRRTYQRAYKAVLFAGKLHLSARRNDARQSELGYMFANPGLFAGHAYYRTVAGSFTQHLANFDLNFLPLLDSYHPPKLVPPDRSSPSLQRTQAMFDWWERLFDYGRVRGDVHRRHKGPVWHLFEEAQILNPADPAPLLRHLDALQSCWALDLSFYQDQSAPLYSVSSVDLQDDRWLIRVWHADRWIRHLLRCFHPKDIATARPALWAAQDPGALMPASGIADTGNANLTAFIGDGCLESGEPRRYQELKRLNDGLRERGRRALIAYLCSSERVQLPWISATTYATRAQDLSDLLLFDVKAGLCERSSRIEEAISAVQTFVRRARLGLEPAWRVGHRFARLWEDRFESYHTWERCKRRELYKENWIEWSELGKARRIEAFRFLETQLRSSTLTLAAPGGLDWWSDTDRSLERSAELIQRRVRSELHPLTAPPQSVTREGFGTLGTPEYADATTWLAAVPQAGAAGGAAPDTPAGGTPDNPTSTPSGGPAILSLRAPLTGASHDVVPATEVRALITNPTAGDSSQTTDLPFWLESAMKLGTRFLRIAAGGVPAAGLRFAPHMDEPRDGCCCECGQNHPILVDEYYFWLVDARYFSYDSRTDAQSGTDADFTGSYQFGYQDPFYDRYQQQSTEWDDEEQVPKLLAKWQSGGAVRLAWCRVHNKQFQQPRRSAGYVAVDSAADLIFLGRAGDSVYFKVSGAASLLPPGYGDDTSPPGFRFDLPTDQAITLPELMKPVAPPVSSPYPGGLICYPFFVYEDPGARLFPTSWFSPALLVGGALREHCRFDLALKWYQRAFDPIKTDCTWMDCTAQDANQSMLAATTGLPQDTSSAQGAACCDSAQTTDEQARHRALTLEFCQTLLDWGDVLMRRRRAPEAFRQARMLFDTAARITGVAPKSLQMPPPTQATTVTQFVPGFAPLNPRLLNLYETVADRLDLIHHCLNGDRRSGHGEISYFGDDPLREGWLTGTDPCDGDGGCCSSHSPYRFTFQIQRALELAGKVRELGAQLLAAYEKGDAEILASIHAEQEREMLALGQPIRQSQWRDADWQVQALQQTKDANQVSLTYYTNLHKNGLINDELQNLTLSTNAMQTRTSANVIAAVGETMTIVPDFFVGAMSTFSQIPIGTKLGGLFDAIAKFMHTVADIQNSTAAIDMTQAGWDRRAAEWFHQMQVLPVEIQQAELQILGAQRRRDQAMQELNIQQRQLENAAELQDFLRDKFTATELYMHLRKQTSGLHAMMYRLARCTALQAQRAFNFERGHTTRRFISTDAWDGLHEGLMAGERLEAALHHMQKGYFDANEREYELTKHFSLRLHFPQAFVQLKTTGCCEVELPEWMYDTDYPGHFMRRFRGLRMTVPIVSGPFAGVHCKVTMLNSQTRIDPRLEVPVTHCCCEQRSGNGYEACPHDRRVVRSYGGGEAIATSSGQSDSGLFELNFQDERRLPFEFHGAVCRLRIELPPENNYFPMETLSDFILQADFTAREGGVSLRRAASEAAQRRVPGSGWCLFDVRHEFPDAWQALRRPHADRGAREHVEGHRDAHRRTEMREHRDERRDECARPSLNLRLERRMFPFIPGACALSVNRVAVLLSMPACQDHLVRGECPCPTDGEPGSHVIEVTHGATNMHCEPFRVTCTVIDECADLYGGVFDARLPALGEAKERQGNRACPEIGVRFAHDIGEIENIYVLCQYERDQPCKADRESERGGRGGKPHSQTSHGVRRPDEVPAP